MSYWTTAYISFILRGKHSISEVENILGHIRSFEDIIRFRQFEAADEDVAGKYRFLPSGSEGTLDLTVVKTTRHYTKVVVHGGLRDVDNTDGISAWFNELIKDNETRKFGRCHHNEYYHDIVKADGWACPDWQETKKATRFSYDRMWEEQKEYIRWKINWVFTVDIPDKIYEIKYYLKRKRKEVGC